MRRLVSKLILWSLVSAVCPLYALGQRDPCPSYRSNASNAEINECYTKAQIHMNKKADEIAVRIAENLRTISPKEKALYSSEMIQMLDGAAHKLGTSQTHWRAYRDDYCNTIKLSYTTGSGAGTAYEHCLYSTAAARVRQLLDDFPSSAVVKAHQH